MSPRAATKAPSVTDTMGRQGPEGLLGIHMNLLVTALGGGAMPADTEQERAALEQTKTFRASGFGYFLEQATRPQTIGYALLDSPVALAAWMLDHDTDAYYKISRAFVDGQPSGGLTRDHILDNITLYWLTGTGVSAARSYWEGGRAQALAAAEARLLRRSSSRSASPRSPARSSGPRAAGSRRATPPSSTSTRPPGAATSPRGKSPSCSQPRSGRRSGHCARPDRSCTGTSAGVRFAAVHPPLGRSAARPDRPTPRPSRAASPTSPTSPSGTPSGRRTAPAFRNG